MNNVITLFLPALLICTFVNVYAQDSLQKDIDSTIKVQTDVIVVTGTRTEELYKESPIPVTVITREEIEESGFVRLTDILAEQTGISITNFLGAGVQMQGLDADYTLIMIDGEPLIGRNGGTIDLNRVTIDNVKQIEIVKGPSSSLYGNDALAGVINIITSRPVKEFGSKLKVRYATNNNIDLTGDVQYSKENYGMYLFLNRYSSDGYDLTPQTESQTGPDFSTYTVNPRFRLTLGGNTDLSLNSRVYIEDITNTAFTTSNVLLDDKQTLNEFDISGSVRHFFTPDFNLNLYLYSSYYKYESLLSYRNDGSTFFEDNFNQTYNKAELTAENRWTKNNLLTTGTGIILEEVEADRIYEGSRNSSNLFAFAQNQWKILKNLELIIGARFDSPSDYKSAFSPKVSAYYKPFEYLSIRSSYGAGFKAPTFQQLYLDFANPQVGYSVFGTYNFAESFAQLESSGMIDEVFIDPASVKNINPETSDAVNFGIELNTFNSLNFKVNLFRNDIRDLIDVLPVARKTNGQSVFTYFNVNRVYTQGLDASIDYTPSLWKDNSISFFFGYQYLETGDKDVVDDIQGKRIFKVGSTGVTRPVQLVEYGGLFNRPMHSGVAKLSYTYVPLEMNVYLRAIMKGKYGFADKNGNLILDNDNEYAPGYVLWNINASKRFGNFRVNAGVENIFDKTSLQYTPELPGRIIFAGIETSF